MLVGKQPLKLIVIGFSVPKFTWGSIRSVLEAPYGAAQRMSRKATAARTPGGTGRRRQASIHTGRHCPVARARSATSTDRFEMGPRPSQWGSEWRPTMIAAEPLPSVPVP